MKRKKRPNQLLDKGQLGPQTCGKKFHPQKFGFVAARNGYNAFWEKRGRSSKTRKRAAYWSAVHIVWKNQRLEILRNLARKHENTND